MRTPRTPARFFNRRFLFRWAALGLLLCGLMLSSAACSSNEQATQAKPDAPEEAAKDKPAARTINEQSTEVLFTYMDDKQVYQTVDTLDEVPLPYRNDVIVVDLKRSPEARNSAETVTVTDLERRDERGNCVLRQEPRARFEQSLKLKRKWRLQQVAPGSIDPAKVQQLAKDLKPGTEIVLYSTTWCGYCKAVKKLLAEAGVSFKEVDIETDEAGMMDMMAKCQKAGIQAGGVPLLDWRGQLISGYDEGKIKQLIAAEKIAKP